jgi:NADPH:quinone reductase
VFGAIRSRAVKVRIGQRFALKDAADAHRALESRSTTGSTILLP